MKTLLIVTDRTLHTAPRVIRALEALSGHFQIHTVGRTAPLQEVLSHTSSEDLRTSLTSRVLGKIQRDVFHSYIPLTYVYPVRLRRFERVLKRTRPDIVMVHECADLPYLASLKNKYGFRLVFNAHEYYPLEFDQQPEWSRTWQVFFEDLYRRFLPEVDLMINVCESIREKCLDVFGKDSLVIPNAAFADDCAPSPVSTPVKLIHHGGANRSRRIEEMIRMASLLGPGYELTLMLVGNDPAYFAELNEMGKNLANVHFIEPVPFREIVPTLNGFDVGLYILPPSSFNNAIALPNKIYEFIQAKLCLAIGPSPEMKRLVDQYQLGVVARDFTAESLAECIRALSAEQIRQYKQNAIFAAGRESAETYNLQLLQAFLAL